MKTRHVGDEAARELAAAWFWVLASCLGIMMRAAAEVGPCVRHQEHLVGDVISPQIVSDCRLAVLLCEWGRADVLKESIRPPAEWREGKTSRLTFSHSTAPSAQAEHAFNLNRSIHTHLNSASRVS